MLPCRLGACLFLVLLAGAGCGSGAGQSGAPTLSPPETFDWIGEPISFSTPPDGWRREGETGGGVKGVRFVKERSVGEAIGLGDYYILAERNRGSYLEEMLDNFDSYDAGFAWDKASAFKSFDAWKKHVGAPRAKPAGRLQFDHLHFVLQAAVDGLGIALAPTSLVSHDLASGRLQSPLPALRMTLERYYYGLAPDAAPEASYVAEWFEQMQARGA